MRLVKRFERRRINRALVNNRRLITESKAMFPDDFPARERLYMRHHELVERREALTL
jgi:hypothetical protein